MGWKIRKYLSSLTLLLFRNFSNFGKVNTPGINQNALILKMSTCEKLLKINKFILNRLEMFYIFWTHVSKWKYIKFWDKCLCTYFYVGSTISSLLQAYNTETRKTISILRPEGVPVPLQAHTPWPSLPPFWNLCFSSLLSCSTPFNPLSINDEYMTYMVMAS